MDAMNPLVSVCFRFTGLFKHPCGSILSNMDICFCFFDGHKFLSPLYLSFAETLELAGNDLTGVIVEGSDLCDQRGEGFGDLKILTTDCAVPEPQVVCDCCTSCS